MDLHTASNRTRDFAILARGTPVADCGAMRSTLIGWLVLASFLPDRASAQADASGNSPLLIPTVAGMGIGLAASGLAALGALGADELRAQEFATYGFNSPDTYGPLASGLWTAAPIVGLLGTALGGGLIAGHLAPGGSLGGAIFGGLVGGALGAGVAAGGVLVGWLVFNSSLAGVIVGSIIVAGGLALPAVGAVAGYNHWRARPSAPRTAPGKVPFTLVVGSARSGLGRTTTVGIGADF